VYTGGDFTTIGGQTRNYIAAIDASTGLATSWNPNPNVYVYALTLSGSTLYAGGDFASLGGVPRAHIAGITDPYAFPVLPAIISIADIPNDQGGKVRVKWNKNISDQPGVVNQTAHYGVWRRIPPGGAALARVPMSLAKISNDTLGMMYDLIATVPAAQSLLYNVVASTLSDSSASGAHRYRFLVTAHTSDPSVLYLSAEDSGYSVDNLPPAAPGGAAINGLPEGPIALQWNWNRTDRDMSHFKIYRSTASGPLGEYSAITTTTDTMAVDSTTSIGQQYFYRITTVDIHDNESAPTEELSQTALAVHLVSFTASVVRGREVVLAWITPTEEASLGFEIQRRKQEEQQWSVLGFVEGHGTSSSPQQYSYADRKIQPGVYRYRLRQVNQNGTSVVFLEIEVEVEVPKEFTLEQNYPNPFNPTTTIEYAVASEEQVTLTVYDNLGRQVRELVNARQEPGYYTVYFNAERLSSGMYYYRIVAGDFVRVKKLLLLK